MEQKIATPEEIERLRQYVYDIVDKYALGSKTLSDGYMTEEDFAHNFDRLWRKPEGEGRLFFIRKHLNPETLTPQEKQEWEKNRIENIKSIGALLKELIAEYKQQYKSETDKNKKYRIQWVINALESDYGLYFGHILEPNMYESKRSMKQLVKESIQRIFESDYDEESEVKKAFDNTDEEYIIKSIQQRNPGANSAGSTFLNKMSLNDLVNANWEKYNHPNISAPAIGYKADIPGKLGVAELKNLPKDMKVKFQPAHAGLGVGVEVIAEIPDNNLMVDHTTLILGPSRGDSSKLTVWTFFPGDPTSKSEPIMMDKIRKVVGGEGDVAYGTVEDAIKIGFNFAKNGVVENLSESIVKIVRESVSELFEADYNDDYGDSDYGTTRELIRNLSEKKKMIVLVGPPSIGKSTWIKNNFPDAYVINRDDIVDKVASSYGWTYEDMFATPPSDAQVGDYDEKFGKVVANPKVDKIVFDKVFKANGDVQKLMKSRNYGAHPSNQDIVVDMTNMTPSARKNALKAIEGNEDKYYKVAVDFKWAGAEDVIRAMAEKRAEAAERMGKSKTIPSDVFDKMFSSYKEPTKSEGFDEIRAEDTIEDLKRALNDDSENLNESIVKIVRESVNKQ